MVLLPFFKNKKFRLELSKTTNALEIFRVFIRKLGFFALCFEFAEQTHHHPWLRASEGSVSGAHRHCMRAGDYSDLHVIQHMLLVALDLHWSRVSRLWCSLMKCCTTTTLPPARAPLSSPKQRIVIVFGIDRRVSASVLGAVLWCGVHLSSRGAKNAASVFVFGKQCC